MLHLQWSYLTDKRVSSLFFQALAIELSMIKKM